MKLHYPRQAIFNIISEAEMINFGAKLAKACEDSKCIIYLSGELGAGKTTLARGFLRAFGYKQLVKSPTYTIVEPYDTDDIKIYHFDLYRLTNAEELTYIGALDYFTEDAIFLIEWPEKGEGILPPPDLICQIDIVNAVCAGNSRLLTLGSNSKTGDMVLEKL